MFNKIIKTIYKAQVASDAAKEIYKLEKNNYKYQNSDLHYFDKDKYILLAIKLINVYNNKNIKYYVVRAKDQHNSNSFIVYFTINNKQISFHCFNDNLYKYLSKGYKTVWDEKCSRDTAFYLKSFN